MVGCCIEGGRKQVLRVELPMWYRYNKKGYENQWAGICSSGCCISVILISGCAHSANINPESSSLCTSCASSRTCCFNESEFLCTLFPRWMLQWANPAPLSLPMSCWHSPHNDTACWHRVGNASGRGSMSKFVVMSQFFFAKCFLPLLVLLGWGKETYDYWSAWRGYIPHQVALGKY